MKAIIRISRPGDEAALKALRAHCFPEGGLLSEEAYAPGGAVITEVDGTLVSAAPLLYPGEAIFEDGKCVPCAEVGATCALESCRGRGYASKELSAAVFQGFGMGAPVAVTRPRTEAQFAFCGAGAGFSDFFYAAKAEFKQKQTKKYSAVWFDAGAEEYGKARERLLAGRFHIRLCGRFLSALLDVCVQSGGGLLLLDTGGKPGCAAVHLSRGTAEIAELLAAPEEMERAVAAVAARFPAERYTVLTPVDKDHCFGSLTRYAMAVGDGSVSLLRDPAALPWYGPLME